MIDDGPEIEYVPENFQIPVGDPNYAAFAKIFEAFKVRIFWKCRPHNTDLSVWHRCHFSAMKF